jgi:predicted AlkP superfamily pyrophosphatase or phosphodiesterase
MGIPEPSVSSADPMDLILSKAEDVLGGESVEKCLIYAPDAIGEFLFEEYMKWFDPVVELAPVHFKVASELPSYTPVSYASMFTGAEPRIHGITEYIKPVLTCDTLFDALPRAGRKVALLAVEGCSNSIIFRDRPIDYHIVPLVSQIQPRALELVQEGRYDVMLVDRQEYDQALHRTEPYSPEALSSVKELLDGFRVLTGAFLKRYEDRNRLVVFVSDHGAHLDPETKKGTHGSDCPLDIEIRHFWGIYKAKMSA